MRNSLTATLELGPKYNPDRTINTLASLVKKWVKVKIFPSAPNRKPWLAEVVDRPRVVIRERVDLAAGRRRFAPM